MDEVTAAAMWSDAQATLYQRRKLLKYIWYSFGSTVVIPEAQIQKIGSGYVKPNFGIYYFRKGTTVKPKTCYYWTSCLPQLLLQSTKHLLEQGAKCSKEDLLLKPY